MVNGRCHMIGAGVTDMIAEAVLGRKLETTGTEVLKAIHPHQQCQKLLWKLLQQLMMK